MAKLQAIKNSRKSMSPGGGAAGDGDEEREAPSLPAEQPRPLGASKPMTDRDAAAHKVKIEMKFFLFMLLQTWLPIFLLEVVI